MVTTFSPPAKPKKKKQPIMPIVLGVVCVALLAGVFYLFNQSNQQTAKISQLEGAILKVAEAAGAEAVTSEALADQATLPETLDALAAAVVQRSTDAQNARAELDQQRIEAGRIGTERQAAMEQLADVRSQLDAVRRDLTERTTQLQNLQATYDHEVTTLRAQIGERSGAEKPVEGELIDGEVAEETDGEEKPAPKTAAMVIPEGGSQLFKTVRYDGPKSQLTFVTLNDQKLVYSNVPEEIYDGLTAAPVFDIYYRFRILDTFPADTNDRELIRSIRRQ